MFALIFWLIQLAWAASINVNTASMEELESLPGIGESKAAAIIQYRTDHGAFASVAALDDVPGIGPSTIANLQALVTVGDGKTVAGGAAPVASSPPSTETAPPVSSPPSTETAPPASSPPAGGCVININTADSSGLMTLPGIGESKAAAILQYRTDHGAFASCQALDDVSGIGPATIANLIACCAVK